MPAGEVASPPLVNASLLSIVGIGFLVGFRHAFEPDHLAAVTTLATQERGLSHAARLGVAWGTGHTASLMAVAALLMLLGVHMPPALYRWAELGVAALLLSLGFTTLVAEARRHLRQLDETHARAHARHHPHAHPPSVRTVRRSFAFGLAHGLAGSGAVIVILVATATTWRTQLGYLLAFGLGTVAGMSLVSIITGAFTGAAAARSGVLTTRIRVGAGVASAVVGLWLGANVLIG